MTALSSHLIRKPQLAPPALTSLNRLESASQRILNRWPDPIGVVPERDREALVQLIRGRLEADRWERAKLSTVTRAGRVLFDSDFRERADLARVRAFYITETRSSTRPAFLSAMMAIYIMSYIPRAPHTRSLASALDEAQSRLAPKWQKLLENVPDIFDPIGAPDRLAMLMTKMSDPWTALKSIGLHSPHAPGLMDHVHLAFVAKVAPRLSRRDEIDRLLQWIKPDGQEARTSGATEAIAALLAPWQRDAPAADLQSHLVEGLVSLYGDPRIKRGFPWGTLDGSLLAVMMRWLTGENIRFFLDVVSAVEESHMWAPRREFWLGLHDKRMIDEAWVAFSPLGARKARELGARSDSLVGLAYGLQEAGGNRSNTSLLILRIGNCIVVEGSHSYKVHVFRGSNKRAPKLFQARYDCERIRGIRGSETVPHLGNWQWRVRELIGYFA